ncbi:MAG: DUF423 domain-containing protein [Bacteroidia bacterium]|nr:DUF423 domain-containing protein [Bacteroidia bacterium]
MIEVKVVRHIMVGAVICSLYILLSAFGAHGLEGKITPNQLATFNTGLRYMIIHGLGIILISLVYVTLNKYNKWVYNLIYLGILFFSSSLIIHALKDILNINVNLFALIAPIGGLCYAFSWILLVLALRK